MAGSISNAGSNFFTPTEAWNIDSKLDDGNPGTGKLINLKGSATWTPANYCTTAADVAPPGDANATYNFTNTNKDCQFYMYF